MIVGVDAREIQNGVITGIGRSLSNFIDYFMRKDTKNSLVLFSEKKIDQEFASNVKNAILKPAFHVFYWDQWRLTQSLADRKIDLFYSPYYKIPLLANVPAVSQILDLMFLLHPYYKNNLNLFQKLYYASLGKHFAKKSLSIITDSEHAKNDIVKHWKIDEGKITVIPLGVACRFRPVKDAIILDKTKKKFNLPERYIFYLGNFKPHKNVEVIIKVFHKIEKRYPQHKLVLAGPLDKHSERITSLIKELRIVDRVILTGTIFEKDHPEALLTLADIFIFPSLYEGFGLPPLEAMACGTPVIASNTTSIPEVVGDSGVLVNPLNINEISNAMTDLLDNGEKRNKYSVKGIERSRLYREENTSAKIYQHLFEILAKGFKPCRKYF